MGMPNFTTKNTDDQHQDDYQENSIKSVISQWDNLPIDDLSEPDESFSEMKPAADTNIIQAVTPNINLTPTRKVVQLQSQAEEIKKPETWAKAVQGLKSVPEFTEKPCDNSEYEKENLEAFINRNNDHGKCKQTAENGKQSAKNGKQTAENGKQTADTDKKSAENGKQSAENGKQTAENGKQTADDTNKEVIEDDLKDNNSDNGPVWILPSEENNKKKKRKKNKKKSTTKDTD